MTTLVEDVIETERADADEELLTFICDGQEYGVDILRVQEIRGWDSVTRVPGTPEFVRGVLNLRGTIVPIVDLRRRFGLEAIPYGDTTVIVVLQILDGERSRVMGIVVDAVSDVRRITPDEVQPPPEMDAVEATQHIRGMITRDEQLIIVLDIDCLLNSPELGGGRGGEDDGHRAV